MEIQGEVEGSSAELAGTLRGNYTEKGSLMSDEGRRLVALEVKMRAVQESLKELKTKDDEFYKAISDLKTTLAKYSGVAVAVMSAVSFLSSIVSTVILRFLK